MLFKRGKIWHVHISYPEGGRPIRRTTGTTDRQLAQEYHDILRASLWRQARLGAKPQVKWQQAVKRWLGEKSHLKSIKDIIYILRWLDPHLRGKFLSEITSEVIEGIAQAKQATPATVNRHIAVISSILHSAVGWEWLDKAPTVRRRKEPKTRVRFLTRAEMDRLLKELPPHLNAIVRFAYSTGQRMSNVTGLKWENLDLSRRVAWYHADETKNEEPLGVYLNREAREAIREQLGKHREYVFTYPKPHRDKVAKKTVYENVPIQAANTKAFRNALTRAGIADFGFHGLRHTWASWHVQAGTPLYSLQQQGNWKDPSMVQRYAHLTAEHFAEHGEEITQKLHNEKGGRK